MPLKNIKDFSSLWWWVYLRSGCWVIHGCPGVMWQWSLLSAWSHINSLVTIIWHNIIIRCGNLGIWENIVHLLWRHVPLPLKQGIWMFIFAVEGVKRIVYVLLYLPQQIIVKQDKLKEEVVSGWNLEAGILFLVRVGSSESIIHKFSNTCWNVFWRLKLWGWWEWMCE